MTWRLANVRVPGHDGLQDLLLEGGRITLLRTGTGVIPDCRTWDLKGRVVLPGLIELHAHLDKTYVGGSNPSGTLHGAIESFAGIMQRQTLDCIEANAERAIRTAITHGVTRLRSHLTFGRERDLALLEVMQGLRNRYRRQIDIQYVAMGAFSGSSADDDLLRRGLLGGIDLLGGAPALSADPEATIRAILDAAQRYGAGLDLHIDETEQAGSRTLATLVELSRGRGLEGRMAASHCCSLAFMLPEERDSLLEATAAAGVALIALPACNLVLMGREQWPVPRGTAPIRIARSAGVTVGVGSDNVQDPFNPFGNYDPLQSVQLAALVGHLTADGELAAALELVTSVAARIFGGGVAVIESGAPADLVVTDTRDLASIAANPPVRLATFKRGELVVQTRVEQVWAQP